MNAKEMLKDYLETLYSGRPNSDRTHAAAGFVAGVFAGMVQCGAPTEETLRLMSEMDDESRRLCE